MSSSWDSLAILVTVINVMIIIKISHNYRKKKKPVKKDVEWSTAKILSTILATIKIWLMQVTYVQIFYRWEKRSYGTHVWNSCSCIHLV